MILIAPPDPMDRRYLCVSPEEYAEVRAAGASWDQAKKSWYIAAEESPLAYARWLAGDEEIGEFTLTSEEAFVASAPVSCGECGERIEVICLYCVTGLDEEQGALLTRLTVSNIWAMDAALAEQLARWPNFRQVGGAEKVAGARGGAGAEGAAGVAGGTAAAGGAGYFANHCPACGAIQEDYLLHSEPGDVFFALSPERPGPVEFTPLVGRVRVGGDIASEGAELSDAEEWENPGFTPRTESE